MVDNAASNIDNNNKLRQALLASAPAMRKNLGVFTGGVPGGNTRIKLFNVGITTRLLVRVDITITIGVATATLSNKAPFNLIQRLKVTDYDGTDRVNLSGFQLFLLNCARKGTYYGYNNESASSTLTIPKVSPLTAGVQTFSFYLEVPLAFDPASDLRGALLTQTAVGEAWLSIDWNPSLVNNGDDNAFFNGAGTTTAVISGTISTTVFQEYLLPQAIPGYGIPLPAMDLMTVYELAGALKTSDNIAQNTEKLINYPNVRSVIGAYFTWTNNLLCGDITNDLQKIRLVANGNNVLREYLPADKLFEQRLMFNSDIRVGSIIELHRQKPIQTALFGNVQMGITPNIAVTTPNIEVLFESFYTKGSTLPGMQQTA